MPENAQMPKEKTIAMGDAIRYGWATMKQHFGFFIVLLIIYYGIILLIGGISEYLLLESMTLYALAQVVSSLVSVYLGIGLIMVGLSFADGKKPTYGMLFQGGPLIWRMILAYMLMGLIVVAPVLIGVLLSFAVIVPMIASGGELNFVSMLVPLLLAIPAIIWAIKFSMALYLIIDKNMQVVAAFKESAKLTEGVKWELLAFFIVTAVINLLGLIALFVGLFVSIPVTFMAYIYVYRKLAGKTPTPLAAETPSAPAA